MKSQQQIAKILSFVPENALILHQKCHTISKDELRSPEVQNLIKDMFHTLSHSSRGVGLSANQVGRNEAISVVATKPTPARPNLQKFNRVYINTQITKTFGKTEPMWEGCLSTAADKNGEPFMARVPRFKKIEVHYLDQDGMEHYEIISGFIAHVLQHETDHLNGILFTDFIDRNDMIPYREYVKIISAQ